VEEGFVETINDTVVFLDPKRVSFEFNEKLFLVKMTYENESYDGISALPAFPLSSRSEFVHIYKGADSTKLKECVGLIEDINELNEGSFDALSKSIQMSCMMPTITKINLIYDEYYNFHWTVETDRGNLEFSIGTPRRYVFRVSNGALLIKDLKDDYYYIPDPTKLDANSRKQLLPIL